MMTSGSIVTVAPPAQLSVAVTPEEDAVGTLLAHCTDKVPTQVIVGGILSNTVMVCEQVAELPQASVAL